MFLAGLHSGFRDDPSRVPVNLRDLAPRGRELRPFATLLRADYFIGPCASQDGPLQSPGVVAGYRGQASVEGWHVPPRHGLVVLDLIITGAALYDDTRLGVPDDRLNPACGF